MDDHVWLVVYPRTSFMMSTSNLSPKSFLFSEVMILCYIATKSCFTSD